MHEDQRAMLVNRPGRGHGAAIGPDGRRLTLPLGPAVNRQGLSVAAGKYFF
jgi:hypothetical protein